MSFDAVRERLRSKLAPGGSAFVGAPPLKPWRLLLLVEWDASRRVIAIRDSQLSIFRSDANYWSNLALLETAPLEQVRSYVRPASLSVRLDLPDGESVTITGRSQTRELVALLPR